MEDEIMCKALGLWVCMLVCMGESVYMCMQVN